MMNQNAQVYGVHNNSSTPLRETLTHPMMNYIFITFFCKYYKSCVLIMQCYATSEDYIRKAIWQTCSVVSHF